jgi:ATP-dependent DNA helicase RecQ
MQKHITLVLTLQFDHKPKTISLMTSVVCATIAFGGESINQMSAGHTLQFTQNIEGYYQEIGRAGRDGLPSETILFESYGDVIQLQNLLLKA